MANLPDVKRRMYQRKVDVNMWNAVKSVLAKHTLYGVQHIHINLTLMHSTFYRYAEADQNYFSQGLVFHCNLPVDHGVCPLVLLNETLTLFSRYDILEILTCDQVFRPR